MKERIFGVLSAASILGFLYWVLEPMRHGELVQKPVYAALQSAHYEHRNDRAAVLEERVEGRLLVGILDEKGQRVWIALGEVRHGGGVYAVPGEAEAGIGCETVRRLAERYEISVDVRQRLESVCLPSD